MKKEKILLLLVIIFYLIVSIFKIDNLPGEWYGDISDVNDYVASINNGKLPILYFNSVGPLYFYLIAPIVKFTSNRYLTYKLTAVFFGLLTVITVYFIGKEAESKKLGLISALVAAFSFWLLVFARLGNLHAGVMFHSALFFLMLVKYYKSQKIIFLSIAGVLAGSGLANYAATFIYPLIFVIFTVFFYIFLPIKRKMDIFLALIFLIPFFLYFFHVYKTQEYIFSKGYIGSKLYKENMDWNMMIQTTIRYFGKMMNMFFQKGDVVFRSNVPGTPHLDKISAVIFIGGTVFWLLKKDRTIILLFSVTFLLLLIPSIMPLIPQAEVPSMSRTVSLLPLLSLLIGGGWYEAIKKIKRREIFIFVSILFILSCYLNLNKYFVLYPNTLPNRNTAYGRIIAEYINNLSLSSQKFVVSCCWGEWGQPEPKAIISQVDSPENIRFIETIDENNYYCQNYHTKLSLYKEIIFIVSPNKKEDIVKIKACFNSGEEKMLTANGFEVAWVYKLNSK